MDMILFEAFLKSIDLNSTTTDITTALVIIIDNAIVLFDLVESSGYSSKTLQKRSCPYYASPLDEVLRYLAYLARRQFASDHSGTNNARTFVFISLSR